RRPFGAILGGSKISGKIDVVESLLPRVDHLLVGGAMACTFFRAMGLETGKSLVEPDRIDMAKELLGRAGTKIVLPVDAVIAPSLGASGAPRTVARESIPTDTAMYDIGPASVKSFENVMTSAMT